MSKNLFTRLQEYLNKPYPYKVKRWTVLILLPLFISLFLIVFKPFGLSGLRGEYRDLLLLGYGMVTFLILLLNMYVIPLIFPKLYREAKWTILSEILSNLWMILTIGIGNYLYSVAFSIVGWGGFYGLAVFVGFTFAIGIIPILIMIIASHNIMLRQNLAGVGEISSLLEVKKSRAPGEAAGMKATAVVTQIRLQSENGQKHFECTPLQLVCIESEGNYIQVCYLADGKISSATLRNTIKNIDAQLAGTPGFFRCHRAFIVNLSHVQKVEGNSQGYRLQMKYINRQVPVSRNYTTAFNQAFREQA